MVKIESHWNASANKLDGREMDRDAALDAISVALGRYLHPVSELATVSVDGDEFVWPDSESKAADPEGRKVCAILRRVR